MTRYVPAFSWTDSIEHFVKEIVKERPILNVCSGDSYFGDVQLEKYHFPKDWFKSNGTKVKGDAISLPFKDDAFGSVFTDPPWDASWKANIASFLSEALRVAPVVYIMAPWVDCNSKATRTYWVREFPGVNVPIILSRYERVQKTEDGGKKE